MIVGFPRRSMGRNSETSDSGRDSAQELLTSPLYIHGEMACDLSGNCGRGGFYCVKLSRSGLSPRLLGMISVAIPPTFSFDRLSDT